ncbi:MAG: type II toxin-antitoxin system Phd/YefM family antitoxin [Hyphomicrobiales bacterium]
MSTYTIAQAKDQLSRIVTEAMSGELVTITRHGKPVVTLQPTQLAHRQMRAEDIEALRRRRRVRPRLRQTGAALVRAMRNEVP